jgi:hypothetical protein
MYIRELTLKNVKLLRDVTLSFLRDGQPRMWTVLLGENGLCKTTLLQALALAASGVDRANQLVEIAALPDRRLGSPELLIRADFSFGSEFEKARKYPGMTGTPGGKAQIRSILRLPPGWGVFEGTSQYLNANGAQDVSDPLRVARAESLPHWFVAGYGVQRLLPVPQLSSDYTNAVLERLATLFNKGRLIGTSFADLFATTKLSPAFRKQLKKALISGQHLLPRITALELRGRGGIPSAADLVESHRFSMQVGGAPVKVPATWLSQGYQGMIAWLADLIGQQFWESSQSIDIAKMEGLVLIDELDLFLHPAWQVTLIRGLKATFPRMQFVVTTHSPMLLSGCERDEVFILEQDEEGNVQARQAPANPALMSGSELYKVFFGVEGLYPTEAGDLLQRYGFLASNPRRTNEEERTMQELRKQLLAKGVQPEWEPVKRRGT